MTYAEKLRDPRWQRKRSEIMERDGWECTRCGEKAKTLNVHHHAYLKGKEPWEYDEAWLTTLCEPCHREVTKADPFGKLKSLIIDASDGATVEEVCDGAYALILTSCVHDIPMLDIADLLDVIVKASNSSREARKTVRDLANKLRQKGE